MSLTFRSYFIKKEEFSMEIPLSVRARGLEPLRRKTPDPKSGAATNYATLALFALCKVTLFS